MLPLTPCCNAESIYSHARALLKAPFSLLVLSLLLIPGNALAEPQPGLAMHGEPREPKGFTHYPYADPDAPKGGRATFAVQGSFDSLNPLIVKGAAADGVREYIYESLLARAYDELFGVNVKGCIFGGGNARQDAPHLLSLYKSGQLNLDDMVTRQYSLEQINEGYQDMLDGKNIRGIIKYTEADW